MSLEVEQRQGLLEALELFCEEALLDALRSLPRATLIVHHHFHTLVYVLLQKAVHEPQLSRRVEGGEVPQDHFPVLAIEARVGEQSEPFHKREALIHGPDLRDAPELRLHRLENGLALLHTPVTQLSRNRLPVYVGLRARALDDEVRQLLLLLCRPVRVLLFHSEVEQQTILI